MGEAALFGIERLRYMSASRSKYIYELQKQVVLEVKKLKQQQQQIFFLDLYEATYLSADWLFPSDGRHYRPDLNRYMLQWFYPARITIYDHRDEKNHKDNNNNHLLVSSDDNGGLFLDNIPKPYYVDPTVVQHGG